jgi:hypothetical protein
MSTSMNPHTRNRFFAALAIVLIAAAATASWLYRSDRSGTSEMPSAHAGADTGLAATPRQATTVPTVSKVAKKTGPIPILSTPAPLPPPNAPLAQVYTDLKARADAGDAPAASRLYRDIARCLHTRDVLNNQSRTAGWMLEDDTSKFNADQLARRERRLGTIEDELAEARANSSLCEGATPAQLQLAPVALRAAQLGDAQAADCYVGAGLMASGGLLDHPEWLQDYKDNALPLANAAVEQGDWAMVSQLQRAYAQSNGAGLLGQVTGADPSQAYAYLKLRSLGAVTSQGNSYLSRQLADAAQNLPADAVAQGDTWAQSTYQQYFGANPQINTPRGFNPCQNVGTN